MTARAAVAAYGRFAIPGQEPVAAGRLQRRAGARQRAAAADAWDLAATMSAA